MNFSFQLAPLDIGVHRVRGNVIVPMEKDAIPRADCAIANLVRNLTMSRLMMSRYHEWRISHGNMINENNSGFRGLKCDEECPDDRWVCTLLSHYLEVIN